MTATKSISDQRMEAQLADWLREGPSEGTSQGLERILSAARSVDQRPRAIFVSSWLPSRVAETHGIRPHLGAVPVLIILTLLLLLALAAVYVGTRPRIPDSIGPSADKLVAFQDGTAVSVARIDGSGRRIVSGDVPFARSPVFSPDGSKIAFVAADDGNTLGGLLYVAGVDGATEPIEVSHGVKVVDTNAHQISWSPDATAIAFAGAVIRESPAESESGIGASIFVAQADGSGVAQITDDTMDRDLPSWSTIYDGDWIAYRSVELDGQRQHLDYVRPDGSEVREITTVVAADASLSRVDWSPTNDINTIQVSYASNFGSGTTGLAVIHPLEAGVEVFYPWEDGIGASNVYGTPWSPNGRWIAILSASDGLVLAESAPPGGSLNQPFDYSGELRRLGPVADCWIDWSPDGTALYGGSPDGCTGTVVIPVDDPDAAFVTYTPMSGVTSWQPLEP